MSKEDKCWAILQNRGKDTTHIEFLDAVVDCMLDLKKRIEGIK